MSQPLTQNEINLSSNREYKIGLGTYRAGTDFPAGEISIRVDTPVKSGYIRATSGKRLKNLTNMVDFKDKIYATLDEGEYIHLGCVYGPINPPAYTFTVEIIK